MAQFIVGIFTGAALMFVVLLHIGEKYKWKEDVRHEDDL